MDSTLIIHLPIHLYELDDVHHRILKDQLGVAPVPYEPVDSTYGTVSDTDIIDINAMNDDNAPHDTIIDGTIGCAVSRTMKGIMFEFIDSNKRNEWPASTEVCCWWCCHQFDTPPCAIPKQYRHGVFYLYGCFCSYNCAVSYNFNHRSDSMWERNALIHLLYQKQYQAHTLEPIVPAPPKECLRMFGGPLDIAEYRSVLKMNNKVYRVVSPPMVAVVPKLEENNKIDTRSSDYDATFIPIDYTEIKEISKKRKIATDKSGRGTLSSLLKIVTLE